MNIYNDQRIARLAEICPVFTSNAQVGDTIEFGLKGDEFFPSEYETNRPTGKIIKIKNQGTPDATIRVRTTDGKTTDVAAHTVSPYKVWEYDDTTYRNKLEQKKYRSSSSSSNVTLSDVDALKQKVEELQSRLESTLTQEKDFKKAIMASMNELANEMGGGDEEGKSFSSVFQREYRNATMKKNSKKEIVFDSDMSDMSDGEY